MQEEGIDVNSKEAKNKLDGIKEKIVNLKDYIKETFGIDIDISNAESETENIKNNVQEIRDALSSIGTGVQKTIKKVLKWGLAIFSVRSAYMFIRQAASTLSQYNEDLKNKIEGIRLALASALEPIVKRLVDWVVILLKYVNAISMALFGWDLFKNAKNMKSMSKSAKEIKNSLAGFDEMNVLADNSSSGSGAGASNFSYDDLYFGEGEEPWWIAFIRDNADAIKEFLGFLLAFGVAFKALDLFTHLGGIGTALGEIFPILKDMGGLKIFGIIGAVALTLKGIYDFVNGLIEFIKDPSWENFSKILKGLGEILLGIGIAMAIIWGFNPATWIMLIIAAVVLLASYIIKHWDKIKETLNKGWNWVKEKIIEPIKKAFEVIGNKIAEIWEKVKKKTNDVWTGIKNTIRTVLNAMIGFINTMIRGVNKIASPIRALIVGIGKVTGHKWTMDNIKIPEIPKLATGGIINRPTYAQIGEAGREAVLPLDRNTEWMNELAKKINSNGGVVNVYLDGRLIQRQYNQRQEEFNFATNGGN